MNQIRKLQLQVLTLRDEVLNDDSFIAGDDIAGRLNDLSNYLFALHHAYERGRQSRV